ncbi:transcriptional regulator ATRX isoform X2 [Hyposmocoma kahamanoa]|uniref:transcriptional regulator ATRX isoform X2 n=1 Tax=Hyposmocoma kahamanoa TaxID=1477025 RepID=UPI000E6D656F|nr:transcriptional regulator ATRX isoform X2 [Hyposmocoma kahamanoa]
MADDVPVCDVLCEAMEYLSKLGLNLRSRSESLKAKRISKEKLKNFHAVQKAAHKVLLICQLSKKSLDNVESGIRKVLSIADAGQQPTTSKGGKTLDKNTEKSKDKNFEKFDRNVKEKPHYHYFEYRSRKLKVAKKISVKHFTSVKVLAKKIPMSLLENYPVYYNCKLYRIRERQALKEQALKETDTIVKKNEDESNCKEKLELKKSIIDNSEIEDVNNMPTTLEPESNIDDHSMESKPEQKKVNKASSTSSIENDHTEPNNKKHLKKKNCDESLGESQEEVDKEPKRAQRTEKSSVSVDSNEAEKTDEAHKEKHVVAKCTDSSENERSNKSYQKSKCSDSLSDEDTSKTPMKSKHFSKRKSSQELRKNSICLDSSEDENAHKSLKQSKYARTVRKKSQKKSIHISSDEGTTDKLRTRPKHCNSSENENTQKSRKMSTHSLSSEDESILKFQKKSKHALNSEDKSTTKSRKKSKHSLSSEDESTHKSQNTLKHSLISDDESAPKSRKKSKHYNSSEDEMRSEKKMLTRVTIIDDDSSDNEKEKQKQCETNAYKKDSAVTNCATDPESEKNNLSNVNVSQENQSDEQMEDAKDGEQQERNPEAKKSLIKCVSLSQLLKPDLLEKACLNNDEPGNKTCKLNRKCSIGDNKMKEDFSEDKKLKKHRSKKVKFDDEEAFWEEKRKMVKTFKPKQFSIHLQHLPEITVAFLQGHNLKKVTRGATVICEIGKEIAEVLHENQCNSLSAANNLENTKQVCHNENAVQPELINIVKSALLNDSESDNSDKEQIGNLEHESQKVKNSLLNESDSENDQQKEHEKTNNDSNAQNKKSSLLFESDSEQNVEKPSSDVVEPLAKAKSTFDKSNSDTSEKLNMIEEMSDKNQDTNKKAILNESDSDSLAACEESKDTTSKCHPQSHSKEKHKKSKKKLKRKSKPRSHSDSESDGEKSVKTNIINKNDSDEEDDSTGKTKRFLSDCNSDNENVKKSKCGNKAKKAALLNDSDSDSGHDKKNVSDPVTDAQTVQYSNKNDEEGKTKINSLEDEADDVENSLADKSSPPKEEDSIDKDEKSRESEETLKNVDHSSIEDSDSKKNDEKNNDSLETYNENQQSEVTQCSKANSGSDDSDKETSPEKLKETSRDKNNDSEEKKTSDHEKTPPTEGDEKEIAKSSLLKDSSGDSPKPIKRKKSDDKPKSKRKHIMESMHAKKMLLTYSSSSDTEDEQLKTVVKDIKKNLLQALDSDEEKMPSAVFQRRVSSSDSDVDILTQVKKSNKNKRKTSTLSEKEDLEEDNDSSNSSRKKMGRSSEKPGSSSNHSENQDDKDIEGLTNLKTLNQSRRRSDSKPNKTESSSKKETRPKSKLFAGEEGLLEVPSSSDELSAAENDAGDEELPSVTLSGLNGSVVEHMAKDDLLEESDSDTSKDKDKSSDDVKKEDDSDTDNVKLKRRKANAISSDSEVGYSKRKPTGKYSDFEDSEDESSEPAKKGKRKKKETDSDASAGSSSDEGKKKRRRIKQIKDSDASGSEDEREGKNKHGRKNIRKVMGKNQLEEATKRAAREERERLARIAERQKTYNNLEFDESGKPDEVVLDKVVLDFDPETKEPLIEVDRGLVKKLKPHQANGIKFMWDACFESVKRIKKDKGSGCILAHCMGLGKTLQVVSLTHTLLTNSDLTGVNRVLVVCPLSTVLNWVNEFRMWLKHAETDYDVDIYELSRFKQNSERAFQLSQWFTHGGVCVLGYEMFRNLSSDSNKKFKKKMLRQFQESLVDPGPEMVVCDEGHLLKNEKTSLSQSMNRVKTRRRIVLTGTPLQNNLKEYYCMVQFVKPNLLGKYNEYLNRFVNPITNGQYTDSTEQDIRVMKRRSHVLHKMLDGAVQRRDYSVLAPFLPPKHEYVLFITLTEVQIKLYQHYLDNYSRRPLAGKSSGFLFPDFQSLQRIWTHPLVLKYNSERYEIMQQKKREREEEDSEGSLVDFIDDDSTPDESSSEDSTSDVSDVSDDSRKKSKKKKSAKKNKDRKNAPRRGTRANPIEQAEEDIADPDIVEVKNENPTEWWIPMVTEDEIEDMRNSHKLVLLFEILRQCEAIGDKVLVFSQSLYSLDLIEHFLGKVDEATQDGRIDEKLGGHVGSWSPGVDYFRLDGSTSCENRSIWCKNFNREDNPRARLFLISTRAGGLGINLVAANRVVIFDVSWNPSHDVQSIFRVYRFGQKKPCYIYRFLAMGTMEEKIYERQVTKQAISKRVIDEQQIDRHYAENDLAELYKFEPRPPAPRPVPLVPKDRFFAEMLKEHEDVIYKFHEHDSLLENKEEETLSEEERKAAWEDFENEKNKPPPAPFPSWPMHNGMGAMPMLQQQQLMYAAVAATLRKDMPNLTDDQVRSMLPLIYGANPGMFGGYDYGLMQKLNDMYKYAQPGMMNPAMMNPVMNAGGAGGQGPGGSSGLQYEPPWQRQQQQQQQQQQMRLQQLLQHQQNFYAGGLGSRDPVAMALQQQRAREMMLGERRPRGRPPLAARPPPTSASDVVNLDSD